jgi:hypothetical protein
MSSNIRVPVMPEPTREEEQGPFEDWLYSEAPSGDCEEVHRKWLSSWQRDSWLSERAALSAITKD